MKSFFQDDNTSGYRAKTVKTSIEKKDIFSWPANSPDLNPFNPLKKYWLKLKIMVHDKAPTCKADLVTTIRESWSQYCVSLIKSMPQKLPAGTKAIGGATKY
uniref:Tc1-like transposase DDE domain-containing protein n=1 Tax=Cyprinodon variegatus TaxID=28743 RepID=A0A3Q2DIB1_CYPVA